MGWEIHPAQAMFPTFADDWDRLNAQLYNRHPFFDSRFVGPLLEYFAKGSERLCIYRKNGVISGAVILQPEGMGRWSSFLPSQTQVTALLLDDARLLESLLGALPGLAWAIELYAVDPRYSPDFSRLDLAKTVSVHANTIGIHSDLSFSEYWNRRPKNLRANVRRYFNRAEKEFPTPELYEFADQTEMRAGVARFGELETAGWKGTEGTAVSIDNRQGEFYSEVLRRFARSNQATVYELRLGDQLAASRLVIGNDQMLVILKTAYNESLARFAPGRMLLYRVLRKRLESQTGEKIEFYTKTTRDQTEWATFSCTIQNIQIFRSDSMAAAFSLLKVFQRTLRGPGHRKASPVVPPADVKVCTSIEAFAEGPYDLHDFSATDNVEVSIDWFDLLQKQVYPEDSGVRYYFVAKNKIPSTILPLRLTTKGRVRTIESLANYYTSLFTPLLTDESDLLTLRTMLATATRDHGGAHIMRFAPMDPESSAFKGLLNELRAIGWIPFKFFCFGNWFLKVNDDWEGYLKKRSTNLRSSIKRRNKEFAAAGGTIEVVTVPAGIEPAIAAFQEVYSSSWKIPEPYPDFVPTLIRCLSANGMLRLGVARIHQKPIAAQLWIVTQDKASIYKLAYHEAYASFSPGTVLTSHLMRHVIEQDHVNEVDFLTGDDKHKRIWMSDRRERWGIVAYNPRTMVGLALFAKEVSGRIAKSAGKKFKSIGQRSQYVSAKLANYWSEIRKKYFHFPAPQRGHNMTWAIYPISQLADFSRQWDALVQSRPGTPFLESAFLLPIVEVYSTGEEKLCLLHSHAQLRAAAIMQRGRIGIWQTFQPAQLPLGAWVSDDSIDFLKECNVLFRQLSRLTMSIGFSQLDSRILARPADSPKVRTQDYIQTAWVDIAGGFETYWEERGKNLKQNTRKQRNKLEAEGIATRIECITAPEDVAKAIEDYGLLEGSGWKGADGTAILPDNDQGRFYRKMLENYCAMGRGRIYRYWFGEKVVAMDLCIQDHVALVILKTAYDESYKTVSPSTLMRQDQFQQLFEEQKFARIEFYGKVMEWHTRWTTQSRSIYHVTSYRWAWLKQLHARLSVPADQNSQKPSSSAIS